MNSEGNITIILLRMTFLKEIIRVYTCTFILYGPSISQNQPWRLEYCWPNSSKEEERERKMKV